MARSYFYFFFVLICYWYWTSNWVFWPSNERKLVRWAIGFDMEIVASPEERVEHSNRKEKVGRWLYYETRRFPNSHIACIITVWAFWFFSIINESVFSTYVENGLLHLIYNVKNYNYRSYLEINLYFKEITKFKSSSCN